MTKEGNDAFGGQLSYASDSYGVSFTAANIEGGYDDSDGNFYALNAYWTPSETGAVPSISVGYEATEAQGLPDKTQYFVGLQWDEAGPGTFGVAYGSIGSFHGEPIPDEGRADDEFYMYEAFYSYALNDGVTITPLIYLKETAPGTDDNTGVMVKTSFSF